MFNMRNRYVNRLISNRSTLADSICIIKNLADTGCGECESCGRAQGVLEVDSCLTIFMKVPREIPLPFK